MKEQQAISALRRFFLAVMAGMYAVYHGAEGLKAIALRINKFARILDLALAQFGFKQINKHYFDTLLIETDKATLGKIRSEAQKRFVNFRYIDETQIGISIK